MTTFGDGVYQYGGVPVGLNRLAEIFNKDNIWFVDYDNGATAHGGQKPDDAFQIPSEAVSAATKEGIVYIRPRTSITSSDVYYSDNITVPVTKPHIQFIGCGAGQIPGYRGSAQIQPSTTTDPIFTIQSSGVCIENLFINGAAHTEGENLIHANRSASAQAVALQVRNCRIQTGVTYVSTGIQLGSCQYCFVEDNLFLDCYRSIHMEAVYGSPQSYTIRRNIFEGKVAERDYDIMITITDINSRGHIIANNIFADGIPAHTDARMNRFIGCSNTSSVSTGIVCGNYFGDDTADSLGTSGDCCKLPAGWWTAGNMYEGTSAAGLSGFLTKA